MDLLLLSNSTDHGRQRFEHVQDELAAFYGQREVLFVPHALADHDAHTAGVDGVATVLHGREAVLFRRGREPEEIATGTDLGRVLGGYPARFDAPG